MSGECNVCGGWGHVEETCPNLYREYESLQAQLRYRNDNSECVHCGELLANTNENRGHWRECTDHPARKVIEQLTKERDEARRVARILYKDRENSEYDRIHPWLKEKR